MLSFPSYSLSLPLHFSSLQSFLSTSTSPPLPFLTSHSPTPFLSTLTALHFLTFSFPPSPLPLPSPSPPPPLPLLPSRLAGYPPFSDEIVKYSLKDQILNARYSFPKEYWGDVTQPAKDMVQRLLTLDPESRITVSDALSHPWLQDREVVGKAEALMEIDSLILPPPVPGPSNVSCKRKPVPVTPLGPGCIREVA